MFGNPGREGPRTLVYEIGNERETAMDEKIRLRVQGGNRSALDNQDVGSDKVPVSRLSKDGVKAVPVQEKSHQISDMELMKERFVKLLLGEDMSGSGKGVSSALALSNAITNLAASAFGEQRKLEPVAPDRKERWRKEIGWLLSVTDYIVEFVPSQQKSKNGTSMEIMVTQQRGDLLMNIPALRKLDAMLIDCLDNFRDNEFWYVSKDAEESEKGVQRDDKWWLPTVKVPPNGLSEASRKWLQYQKECVNQVLKASMAINAQTLSEMEIPEDYIESLPKNGRATLGDLIYKSITVEFFDPEIFLSTIDLSSEHKVLDLKNKMEASIVIWKRKMHQKDSKSSWVSTAISFEKRELFEERAETILLLLKQRFPGLPQSTLDISKIEYNKDVGYSILESYSRVLESLANTVMSRIEDVLYADSLTQDPSLAVSKWNPAPSPLPSPRLSSAGEDVEKLSCSGTPSSMTLSDFMGWNVEEVEADLKKNHSVGNLESYGKDETEKSISKPGKVSTPKKFSYIEKIENGLRSPTARH